jgi:hypothetical protein
MSLTTKSRRKGGKRKAMNIGYITVIAFAILAAIFFVIAGNTANSRRENLSGYTKATGILIGFREIDRSGLADDYLREPSVRTPVTEKNSKDSLPVFRFEVNGEEYIQEAEFPCLTLGKNDIGKTINILVSEEPFVYVDDADALRMNSKAQARVLRIFYGTAVTCTVIAIVALAAMVFVTKTLK